MQKLKQKSSVLKIIVPHKAIKTIINEYSYFWSRRISSC